MSTYRPTFAAVSTLALAGLMLTGCGSDTPGSASSSTTSTPSMSKSESMTKDKMDDGSMTETATSGKSMAAMAGAYLEYSAYQKDTAKYKDAKTVLFFHAPWCPNCRGTEADILKNKDSLPSGLAIVKVDYDSAKDLREKYKITSQHTFVLVDAQGNLIKKWVGSPSAADIATKAA